MASKRGTQLAEFITERRADAWAEAAMNGAYIDHGPWTVQQLLDRPDLVVGLLIEAGVLRRQQDYGDPNGGAGVLLTTDDDAIAALIDEGA